MPSTQKQKLFAEEMIDYVTTDVLIESIDNAIVWIENNLDPDDVFSAKELRNWAEANGYTKD